MSACDDTVRYEWEVTLIISGISMSEFYGANNNVYRSNIYSIRNAISSGMSSGSQILGVHQVSSEMTILDVGQNLEVTVVVYLDNIDDSIYGSGSDKYNMMCSNLTTYITNNNFDSILVSSSSSTSDSFSGSSNTISVTYTTPTTTVVYYEPYVEKDDDDGLTTGIKLMLYMSTIGGVIVGLVVGFFRDSYR